MLDPWCRDVDDAEVREFDNFRSCFIQEAVNRKRCKSVVWTSTENGLVMTTAIRCVAGLDREAGRKVDADRMWILDPQG